MIKPIKAEFEEDVYQLTFKNMEFQDSPAIKKQVSEEIDENIIESYNETNKRRRNTFARFIL